MLQFSREGLQSSSPVCSLSLGGQILLPNPQLGDQSTAFVKQLIGRVRDGYRVAPESFEGFFAELERIEGITLIRGTLNLQLGHRYEVIPEATLDKSLGNGYENLHYLKCQVSDLKDGKAVNAIIVRTSTQAEGRSKHGLDIIEIAASVRLREHFAVDAGHRLKLLIDSRTSLRKLP